MPPEMTVQINQRMVAMRGSERTPARCCALVGEVGTQVQCSIYEQRAQVCRDIMYTGYNGLREEKCDKARIAHGMPPLEPDFEPEQTPPLPKIA